MTTKTAVLSALTTALVLALPIYAAAHGNRPRPRMLYLDHIDAQVQVLVSSDQGLHLTLDDGARWQWVCEDIIGYDVYTFGIAGTAADPKERTWLAGGIGLTQDSPPAEIDGLYLSQDGGCNWTPATGILEGHWTSVIAVNPDAPDEVLVGTQHSTKPNGVAISEDAGATWTWTELRDLQGEAANRKRWINGMVRAGDAQVVYASSAHALHTSLDGGNT